MPNKHLQPAARGGVVGAPRLKRGRQVVVDSPV